MKKRVLSIFLSLLTILLIIPTFNFSAQAADYSAELRKKGFPESYISSLNKLKQAHPNWNFEALNVGEDFSYAVSQERKSHSQQLIQMYSGNNGKDYYCTCSKCYKNGKYVIMEGTNWVSASQKAVEYYLDPRNFFDEQHIFQFESTTSTASETQAGVEGVLQGTWMYNANITYKDQNGKTITYSPAKKYSQAIMEAAKYSGLSAYYLASKIVQEVGGKSATAAGASGTYGNYKGIYNYYNIGANTGATDGLKWASQSSATGGAKVQTSSGSSVNLRVSPVNGNVIASVPSGTSVTTYEYTAKQSDGYKWVKLTNVAIGGKTYTGYIRSDYFVESASKDTYNRPWTNPYLTIYNGAKWIANNFGNQYTGYLQKFNVNPKSSYMHSHEYMANVQAAATESVKTYTAYKNAGSLNNPRTFSIPVFKNMPNETLTTPKLNPITVNANGTFTLSWNAVSDAVKYGIYLQDANGKYNWIKTVTTTSWTTGVAQYGKTYSYKVWAVGKTDSITSDFSNAVTAVNNKKLQTPSLKATVNSNGTFTLSWNAITGTKKYGIYLQDDKGNYNWIKTITSGTSWTTGFAQYGKAYSYKVWAVGSSDSITSDFSTPVTAVNNKKLSTPTLKATVNANGTFTLSWNAIAGTTKYGIYLQDEKGNYNWIKTVTNGTSWTTEEIQPYGKTLSYKVWAVGTSNSITSDFSTPVTAVNNKKLQTPSLKATVNSNGTFTLSWNAIAGTTKYGIYLQDDKGNYNWIKTITNGTSWTTDVAQYGKTYSYKVWSVGSSNSITSDFSNPVTAVNNKKLATPTLKVTVNANGTFTLSWNAIAGTTKYGIYLQDEKGNYNWIKTITNGTSWTTDVAQYGKTYSYKMWAVGSSNSITSDFSNAVTAVNSKKMSAPTLKATVNANGTFTLNWNDVYGAVQYEIYVLNNNTGKYQLNGTVAKTNATTALAPYGVKYSYKVRAINSQNAASDFSNVVTATNNIKLQTPALKVTENANGTFTLSWNAIAGTTKYGIYLQNANGTYSWIKTITNGTSWTTGFAQYGKTYSYKVWAVGKTDSITSDFSNPVTAVNNKKLQTPSLSATVNYDGTVTLSWNTIAGTTKYGIYLQDEKGNYNWIKTVTTTSWTTEEPLPYGKTYSYKVWAVGSSNSITSEFSTPVSVTNTNK